MPLEFASRYLEQLLLCADSLVSSKLKASVLWVSLFSRAASLPSSKLEGIPEAVKKGVSSHFSLSFPCSPFPLLYFSLSRSCLFSFRLFSLKN